jgi:alpha,alpha-trehalase
LKFKDANEGNDITYSAWPPHQYIILEALRNLPSNLTQSPLPLINDTFAFIPPGQLGLTESQLPPQPLADGSGNAVGDVNMMNGTVVNGGNATTGVNGGLGQPGWSSVLERELANRYISSAFCSWCVLFSFLLRWMWSDLFMRGLWV